eukprot:TRINITY_DN113647_c0_g1_i1.p1 TRINITY_DN113647_c0_g1~~TRINITY_DN113647_c0_g1_i1.p1  ORF type:complete len:192 (-),score=18.48 TRINITY_DN113647_c0_g1_i1:2-577(-)
MWSQAITPENTDSRKPSLVDPSQLRFFERPSIREEPEARPLQRTAADRNARPVLDLSLADVLARALAVKLLQEALFVAATPLSSSGSSALSDLAHIAVTRLQEALSVLAKPLPSLGPSALFDLAQRILALFAKAAARGRQLLARASGRLHVCGAGGLAAEDVEHGDLYHPRQRDARWITRQANCDCLEQMP